MQPTYNHNEWMEHERQINAYKYNIAMPHYVEPGSLHPGSVENRRYSKGMEEGSKRALTSQPGKRSRKSRLTSGSMKGRVTRKSEKDAFDDNPYNSGLDQTTQNPFQEDDESNLINITTQDNLNKTEPGELQSL